MSMTLDEVISEANAHREVEEGIGLSETLVQLVEFAYEQGCESTERDPLLCIDHVQNFCEEHELYPLARLLDEIYDEIRHRIAQEEQEEAS